MQEEAGRVAALRFVDSNEDQEQRMLEISILVALELQQLLTHGMDEVEERTNAGLSSEHIFI